MLGKKRGLLLVLGVFLIVLTSGLVSAEPGCFVFPKASEEFYCVSNLDREEVREECASFTDCNLNTHFIAGSNCLSIPECALVTCSVDCNQHALGWCGQYGLEESGGLVAGKGIPDEQVATLCPNLGCCIVQGTNICETGRNSFQCDVRAKQAGVSTSVVFYQAVASVSECISRCGVTTIPPASLTILVKKEANQPASGVTIFVDNENNGQTTAEGKLILSLTPRTYQLKAELTGYLPATSSVTLSSGEAKTVTLTLAKEAEAGTLKGKATLSDRASEQITISWEGPTRGSILTNFDGTYGISPSLRLLPGGYVVRASFPGYEAQQKTVQIRTNEEATLDFTLTKLVFAGVTGIAKKGGVGLPGAKIYVDGVFQVFSFGDGLFELAPSSGEHRLLATFSTDHHSLPSSFSYDGTILKQDGQEVEQLLVELIPVEIECDEADEYKSVTFLRAGQLPGEKAVKLEWEKPCDGVKYYVLTKNNVDIVHPSIAQTSYVDTTGLEWGKTYIYTITPQYDSACSSCVPATAEITLGNLDCEGRNPGDTFCLIKEDIAERVLVYTCNEQNQFKVAENCRDSFGEGYYCAPETSTTAKCKSDEMCLATSLPFGLYAEPNACYEAENPQEEIHTFCYYDYSEKTIVNKCDSCLNVENCFAYKGKDACEINSCLTTPCSWVKVGKNEQSLLDYSSMSINLDYVQTTTEETGAGFCVEQNYGDNYEKGDLDRYYHYYDNFCNLCGKNAPLFENYFCTADVCSSLGRCFSKEEMAYCEACQEKPDRERNCYAYRTELECTGKQATEVKDDGLIALSKDSCGWGRCAWKEGACVKDGDGNNLEDCSADEQRENCKLDVTPPETRLISEANVFLSNKQTKLEFTATDDQGLGTLFYCLQRRGAEKCDFQDLDSFSETSYTVRGSLATAEADFAGTLEGISGETLELFFFSKDKFSNQENAHKTSVFVDTVNPEFGLAWEDETQVDLTDLVVTLENINEPLSCTFSLIPQIPPGVEISKPEIGLMNLVKQAEFTDLTGIKYTIKVICEDAYGNEHEEQEDVTFDLEENIDIIYPPLLGAVKETSIEFEVTTAVAAANCDLYTAENTKVADFQTDETGKSHKTEAISGFVEGSYAGTHKVVCQELLSGNQFTDFFNFKVDFTPPETKVILREAGREVRPEGRFWEEYFVNTVNATLECASDGFACEKIYYCLGQDCERTTNIPPYREYSTALILEDSTQICYYSTDKGNNRVFQAKCGQIHIDGFGITLENPEQFFFDEEIWGVSKEVPFDWIFFTRIPTAECKFDFSPRFNYENTPPYKTRTPNSNGRYVFAKFPESVYTNYPTSGGEKSTYVQCKDELGNLGEPKKIVLGYDPSKPEIKAAYAEPDPVLEGVMTTLFVTTDDKTVCKFSDNSNQKGSKNYEMMEFSFPGEKENLLGTEHEAEFTINNVQEAKKTFLLNVVCKNGAGLWSEVKELNFKVNYEEKGNIISVYPNNEDIASRTVELAVETLKTAYCEYKLGETFSTFANTGGLTHTQTLTDLEEKDYVIPVRCFLGDHLAEAQIKFGVDLTPPKINQVDDGNYTCGSDLHVRVESNETRMVSYAYELYEQGRSSFGSGTKVADGAVGPKLPIVIPTENLGENKTYFVKVTATDVAGTSLPVSSDGVKVVSKDYPICAEDGEGPSIEFLIDDSSCILLSVQLDCEDLIGCNQINYGVHADSDSCKPDQMYMSAIELDRSAYICYNATDNMGHLSQGRRAMDFPDEDGDGIMDHCDLCADTRAGKTVDGDGCALGEGVGGTENVDEQKDTDRDGLPDFWETIYNSFTCLFDTFAVDSDNNGVPDDDEDYDNDGRSNYEEYLDSTNPCAKDKRTSTSPLDWEEGGDKEDLGDDLKDRQARFIWAWVLFLLGVLMILGGTGYLIYDYRAGPKRTSPAVARTEISVPSNVWKQKISPEKAARVEKEKERKRSRIFEEFQ